MSKRYTLLLSLLSILFLALFSLLCYYSRLATDDYYFIWDVRTHGLIGGVVSQYMEWCGRYAATFLVDFVYGLFDVNQKWYSLFPVITFLLLVTGIYKLISSLLFRFNIQINSKVKMLVTIYYVILLFFSSVDIGETWMWYCALSSYLWSVIAFVWACSFIFGNYKKTTSIFLSSLCLIYAGGSSEVYSVFYGLILLLVIFYRYKESNNFTEFKKDPIVNRIFIPYVIFGVAFLIFLIAPGNYLRDQLFPQRHAGQALIITAKSIIKFCVLFVPFRLAYIIAFAVPFIVLGNEIQHKTSPLSFKDFFKRFTILFLLFALLFFMIIAYVMMETGPPRLWFILSFLFSSYVITICFYAGYSRFIDERAISLLKKGGLGLSVLILGYNLWHQSVICPAYAAAHDSRIEYITHLNKNISRDTIIGLPPLPSSGMLYSSEIKGDTNHFTNKELRLGYDLRFHVVTE